jgi:hypothetical protein
MNKWTFITVLTLGLQATGAWAQASGEAASWTRIPTDPRSAAMGESMDALAEGTASLSANPAGLGYLDQSLVSFDHNFWILGISMEHAAVAGEAGNVGFGLAADYLDFGTIQTTSAVGGVAQVTGSINPQAYAITGALGTQLAPNFYAGAAAKYLEQNLANNDPESSLAGNLGVLFHNPSGFSAGFALLNIGRPLDGFNLPLELAAGASSRFAMAGSFGPETHTATFAVGWTYLPDAQSAGFSVGGEYWYRQFVALRAGYRFAPYGESDGLEGLSFGGGVKLDRFELSYAMTTLGAVGNTNQVALSMRL